MSTCFFFFFNDTATTEIYTLSLHDALPICAGRRAAALAGGGSLPLPDSRSVPGRAGNHLDRAHLDLDRAVLEGYLQPSLHLRRLVGVRLLCDVLRRRAAAAAPGGGSGSAVQDVG